MRAVKLREHLLHRDTARAEAHHCTPHTPLLVYSLSFRTVSQYPNCFTFEMPEANWVCAFNCGGYEQC